MSLRDVTRAIIAQVERVSGHPVLVTEDRSLQTLAAVRMARGNAPAHTIRYNPAASTQLDYLIAHQCGFILRLFANPPSERWDFAPVVHGREIVHRLLSEPDGPARKLRLEPHVVEKLRDQLFDGLMVQLRSIPVGLRVDTWILRDYAELVPLHGGSRPPRCNCLRDRIHEAGWRDGRSCHAAASQIRSIARRDVAHVREPAAPNS